MSWGITSAGKAQHVKEKFAEKVASMTYLGDTERAIVAAHQAVVDAHCDKAIEAGDERPVIAESSGHFSGAAGNSKIEVRTIYE